jgi:hypothetical protein
VEGNTIWNLTKFCALPSYLPLIWPNQAFQAAFDRRSSPVARTFNHYDYDETGVAGSNYWQTRALCIMRADESLVYVSSVWSHYEDVHSLKG